ncbi:MAG: hypothetical protein JOZ10_17880, partial [Acidobacteria bacterium]|nr:hypothetical protein [Acidobacteriota bacterium]
MGPVTVVSIRRFGIQWVWLVAAFLVVSLCTGCATGGSATPEASGGSGVTPQSPPTPPEPPVPPTPPVPPSPPTPPGLPTVSLSATPSTIVAGQLTTLSWTTSNATSITFSPDLPSSDGRQLTLPSGSATFPLSGTTTYVATVTDGSGHQASANVAINVLPVQFNFSAAPDTIQPGGSATLTWTSQGISSLSIDQGIGDVSGL